MFSYAQISSIVEQDTVGRISITSGSPYLLIVMNGRCWHMIMDDKAYIRLVDTHSKRIGRANYVVVIHHELLLNFPPHTVLPIRMIVFRLQTLLLQERCYHHGTTSGCSINNTSI